MLTFSHQGLDPFRSFPIAPLVDSFIELVQRSRLMSADQLQQVLQELEAEGAQFDTPEALADALADAAGDSVMGVITGASPSATLTSTRALAAGVGGVGAEEAALSDPPRPKKATPTNAAISTPATAPPSTMNFAREPRGAS